MQKERIIMDLYRFGYEDSYTPDIKIEKRENKFGIIYLPTGEILLPFEYENIMINSGAINNFFVVKNGLFGAIHFEGAKYSENDFCIKSSDLPIYAETPKLVCDIPCEYDYFHVFDYGESAFYNNRDNAYLHVGSKNTVMHFEEILIDDSIRLWGKKNNTLYLVSSGEIEYEEVFKGFRFYASHNYCAYIDYDNNEKLVYIEGKLTLMKYNNLLSLHPQKLYFDDKVINFEYYSKSFVMSSQRIDYTSKLLGIREENGTYITFPFAHTLIYVGGNRFIANCEDGKFGLCEIKYRGQVETDRGVENLYDWFPKFLLEGYDFMVFLGKGYYEFIKEGAAIVIYDSNNGVMKNHF